MLIDKEKLTEELINDIYLSNARRVRLVFVAGSLNSSTANGSYSGAPVCLFNPKIFQSTPIGGEK